MKKPALFVLLLLATLSGAAQKSDEYPIKVHVSSSKWATCTDLIRQDLNVIVDGKKFELGGSPGAGLLALGDYKAKLVKDEHKNTYESLQEYEFLLPDKKTRKFSVVGQTE